MHETLRSILLAADDPVAWECPADFPRQAEIERVEALRPRLEEIIGLELALDDKIQDAAHFAELHSRTGPQEGPTGPVILTRIGILFSAFGRLATIWGNVPEEPIRDALRSELEGALKECGYQPLPIEALQEPYTGSNRHRLEDRDLAPPLLRLRVTPDREPVELCGSAESEPDGRASGSLLLTRETQLMTERLTVLVKAAFWKLERMTDWKL